ncbi:hypothetical protein [Rodentibacter genomosp. 2]|uniref:hypothetical protein n=1 Tax=Rodentibacter genomosp. 2 TaxID=1908266 RepID=UPI0015C336EC|nr:hypothetical protein [Rodentibacter genomosp. 2]
MLSTILTSALISLLVSLLVHWFTVTQVTKWFDKFFNEETKVFEKYAKDIKDIVKKNS